MISHYCVLSSNSHPRRPNVNKVQEGLILLTYFVFTRLKALTEVQRASSIRLCMCTPVCLMATNVLFCSCFYLRVWKGGFGIPVLQMRKGGLRGIKVPRSQLCREKSLYLKPHHLSPTTKLLWPLVGKGNSFWNWSTCLNPNLMCIFHLSSKLMIPVSTQLSMMEAPNIPESFTFYLPLCLLLHLKLHLLILYPNIAQTSLCFVSSLSVRFMMQ